MASQYDVLVTGAAGFIGSHVAGELTRESGVRVIAVDDLSGGSEDNLPAGAEFVGGNTADPAFVRDLFNRYRFRHVYHLAAYAAEGLSHHIRRFNYTNNLIGSVNLINAAIHAKVQCFVFTSSIAVYGEVEPPMRESQAPRPIDPYGIAKLAVEQDLAAAHRYFGLPFVIFRPHNVYGPHQNLGDPYRNVIGIFMNQIMAGKAITIFGDGSQRRAFSYVEDVAPVIARAPHVPAAINDTFNIGADQSCSVLELAHEVASAMGQSDHPIEFLKSRDEVHVAHASHEKLRQVFGAVSETPLSKGLRAMAAWAHKQGPQQGETFDNIEVIDNLPPSWRSLAVD